jgi:predicted Zn-dependent protease
MAAIVRGFGPDQSNPFVAGQRRFSREQEKEADLFGLRYLVRQGYDPRAVLRTMDIFQYACGDQRPEAVSTHPSSDNRRQYLEEEIQRRYSGYGGSINEGRFRQNVLQRQ